MIDKYSKILGAKIGNIIDIAKPNNHQKVIIIERANDNEVKVYNQVKRLNFTFLSM